MSTTASQRRFVAKGRLDLFPLGGVIGVNNNTEMELPALTSEANDETV